MFGLKKLFCLVVAMLFLLFSCGSESDEKSKPALPLTVTATHSGSKSEFTATVTESECEIILGENHSLAGTRLYFSPNGNKAENGDFAREVKSGIFPAYEAFFKAICAICNSENAPMKTENGEKYTIDEMTIMVYYDKDTEQIIGIGTEESGRSFDFDIVSLRPTDEIQSYGER